MSWKIWKRRSMTWTRSSAANTLLQVQQTPFSEGCFCSRHPVLSSGLVWIALSVQNDKVYRGRWDSEKSEEAAKCGRGS